MTDINKIDKNFAIKEVADDGETEYYGCLSEPFKIFGLIPPDETCGVFHRMDVEVAKKTSDGVLTLCHHSAGGRLKFKTDSPFIIIKAEMPAIYKSDHFTLCGSAGFDLYAKSSEGIMYRCTFRPPYNMTGGYTSKLDTGSTEMTEYTIHFPLYSRVKSLSIGLKTGSEILAPDDYRLELPVVYYGSSITQGGCASRPGMAYQNIISRELCIDHINLGFSGSAKGEDAIAEYIASLPMSAFVYDYDYNAPSVEHLAATHSRMFKIIREKNPDLPIIMASRPSGVLNNDAQKRLEIIKATYDEAVQNGDKKVWFINMSEHMRFKGGNEGTVDNCHPTDLGFRRMADAFEEKLIEALEL